MEHTIDDLRKHLFDTLKALKDKDNPMDLARAGQVANVARAVIESAKVEVDFLRTTGALKSTGFIPDGDEHQPERPQLPGRRPQ
jgi:hypothetical protein